MEFVKRLHYKTVLENLKFDINQSVLTQNLECFTIKTKQPTNMTAEPAILMFSQVRSLLCMSNRRNGVRLPFVNPFSRVDLFYLLKLTGYVMHQQFNIQQLYALPTLYLCVLYLSENKQRLVPLTA